MLLVCLIHNQKAKPSSSSSLACFERVTSRKRRQSNSDSASNEAKETKLTESWLGDNSTSEGTTSGLQSDISAECEQLKCKIDQLEIEFSQLEDRSKELQSDNEQLKSQKMALRNFYVGLSLC